MKRDLWESDPGILTPFYTDHAVFGGSMRQSSQFLNLILERRSNLEYFPDLAKLLFIAYLTDQWETEKREFDPE